MCESEREDLEMGGGGGLTCLKFSFGTEDDLIYTHLSFIHTEKKDKTIFFLKIISATQHVSIECNPIALKYSPKEK